jgi:hypothetical protein
VQVVSRLQAGQGDEIIEQHLGVVGPYPVVELGGPVERLPQPLVLILRMHRANSAIPNRPGPVLPHGVL